VDLFIFGYDSNSGWEETTSDPSVLYREYQIAKLN